MDDQVAGHERHQRGQVRHQRRDRVHQVGGGGRLAQLAVQPQLDADLVGRAGLVGRGQARPAGRRAVEDLAGDPLGRGELAVAGREVVEQEVARDVVEGVLLGHVARLGADHERHLGLVVDLVGGQLHGRAVADQRVGELGEEGGRLRRIGPLLLGVRAVVEPDADDLARACRWAVPVTPSVPLQDGRRLEDPQGQGPPRGQGRHGSPGARPPVSTPRRPPTSPATRRPAARPPSGARWRPPSRSSTSWAR